MTERSGSCLCGSVSFTLTGDPGAITYCHCTMCQKAHGAPFGAYMPVRHDHFQLNTGSTHIRRYRSSPDVERTFCEICGSTLQFIRDGRPGFGLAVACLDADPGTRPALQIWTGSRADWFTLDESIPTHEGKPAR